MVDDVIIRVEHVGKTFRLPHERQTSLKGALISLFSGGRRRSYEHQQALRDVSFDVKRGEFFGIVGRNGSGKSTLLKLLAGIYTPTKGAIHVNGKLTPFIELGVGFNPELTGRENVFLNGALLGFNRKEMRAMYDDIVAFAELERFMDQKLKNYSSGMQVRLAFSIAIRAKSDVLVLDEVLAVGDEAFQRKCLDVFERYKAEGQTVILVTHEMETVKKYCSRAVLIHDGNVKLQGNPHEVAKAYSELNQVDVDKFTSGEHEVAETGFKIALKNGKNRAVRFKSGSTMTVELTWKADERVKNAGVAIYSSTGTCVFATNTFVDKLRLKGVKLSYNVRLDIKAGRYYIMAGTFGNTPAEALDFVSHGPDFSVEEQRKTTEEGIVQLVHNWKQ